MFRDGQLVGTGWGHQPYEAYLSTVCEAFHCTPAEAEKQDRRRVEAILDYRMAAMAVSLSKREDGLGDYPEMADMLDELRQVQTEAIEGNRGDSA